MACTRSVMDQMLEVRPTDNVEDIKAVLAHPEIWDAITDDYCPPVDQFDFAFDGWRKVCGYDGGRPFAVMMFHEFADGEKLHIQVLPDSRDKSREFAGKALEYANYPLYAEIPEIYQNVIKFADEFGFIPICHKPEPHIKRGESCNVLLMRKEHGRG